MLLPVVLCSLFGQAYTELEFVRPLVQDMMRADPATRPTARKVEERFTAIRRQLSPKQLRSSPGLVRGYDVTEYILGNVPARVPPQRSGGFFKFVRRGGSGRPRLTSSSEVFKPEQHPTA